MQRRWTPSGRAAWQEVVPMRRVLIVAVILVAGGSLRPTAPAVAQASPPAPTAAAGSLQADFNGDTFADLAVGVPFEDVGAIAGAGAVNVLYGAAGGLTGTGSQLLTQDTRGVGSSAEVADVFGSARWRPVTSTVTATPTWLSAHPARMSAAPMMLGRSTCCSAPPAG
jgi:hypothetical protein